MLDWLACICYLIWFKKSKVQIQALINFSNKINAIILGYALKLGLKVRTINVEAQKIDDSTFEAFKMVLACFQVEDKLGRTQNFQKTFLLAKISVKVVLTMPFLTFSNADI